MGSLWNRSGTIERYGASDLKAGGAKAYFYEAGTTNAMIVYEDAGEARPRRARWWPMLMAGGPMCSCPMCNRTMQRSQRTMTFN